MAKVTQELFVDEIHARCIEADWGLTLDSQRAPFQSLECLHLGEGGCTTIYSQSGRMVGMSTRFRDEFNRTLLICVDLR